MFDNVVIVWDDSVAALGQEQQSPHARGFVPPPSEDEFSIACDVATCFVKIQLAAGVNQFGGGNEVVEKTWCAMSLTSGGGKLVEKHLECCCGGHLGARRLQD